MTPSRALLAAGFLLVTACTGEDAPSADRSVPDGGACGARSFDSTFEAIQKVVFDGYGCTNDVCHGKAVSGGLDLRADVAYENLIEVRAQGTDASRVLPGQASESYLFAKLRAGTEPDSVRIEGSPMPSGGTPLTANHLEAVRRWIQEGAPRTGSIIDPASGSSAHVAALLDSCLPDATPVSIKALDAPEANEGIQFSMPPFGINAGAELEYCFAQYYDFSSLVPAEFQDAERGVFFVNGKRLRQDPQSHHLALAHSHLDASYLDDPSFGRWACRGGARDGETCDPRALTDCGEGACGSEPTASVACIGYGPPQAQVNVATGNIGGAQTAQQYIQPIDGVYEEIPLRGIVFWNSHAFNLTQKDAHVHAWLNLYYTADRRFELQQPPISAMNVVAGQAPFTRQVHCGKWEAPRGSTLYWMTSHTHKRGSNFTVDAPGGERIYSSTLYSDPFTLWFESPIVYDAEDAASRTFTYCAEFNNGVGANGQPDPGTVTRASRMPERASCIPTACAAGKVGALCNGSADGASCDSSPGAGDGSCDACPITAGVTTEDEMFLFFPRYSEE